MIIGKENYLSKVGVDYDGVYNCSEMGCEDEEICRCYKITEIKNTKLNLKTFSRYLYSYYKKQEYYERSNKIMKILSEIDSDKQEMVNIWGINEILSKNRIWEIKNWDFIIGGMYYGDEISAVYPKDEIVDLINKEFKMFLNMNTLKEKTNYFFPSTSIYDGSQYSIEYVRASDIYPVENGPCDESRIDFGVPISVCKKERDKWICLEGGDKITSCQRSLRSEFYIIGIS